MAHHTEQVGLQALPLPSGMIIKIEARSPTTDAEVAGVTSTRWSIYGYDESEEPDIFEAAPDPLYIPFEGQ